MSKHTPGPWTIDDTGMYLQVRGNLSDRKHMAHEEVVARVSHWDDARFITAAPEMLEALETVIGVMSHRPVFGPDGLTGHEVEMLTMIRQAIAKAKGDV